MSVSRLLSESDGEHSLLFSVVNLNAKTLSANSNVSTVRINNSDFDLQTSQREDTDCVTTGNINM